MAREVAPEYVWSRFVERHRDAWNARRSALGTHALVVGVSAYPSMSDAESEWKMPELDSAAVSALRFAEWLNFEFRPAYGIPLRTLRVLLSPSPSETHDFGERLGSAPMATWLNAEAALRAWKDDCTAIAGGTAVLYVAGHGVHVASREGSNLLLQDVHTDIDLGRSLDLRGIVSGLGHLGLDTSYAFLDTCQNHLPANRTYNAGLSFSYDQTGEERRGGYVYAAAARGASAYGRARVGSRFLDGLLDALARKALVQERKGGPWVVTSHSLATALGSLIEKPEQHTWPSPGGRVLAFHAPKPPLLGSLTVSLEPQRRAEEFELRLTGPNRATNSSVFRPNPFAVKAEPGIWSATLFSAANSQFDPPSQGCELRPFDTEKLEFVAR